MIDVKKAIVSAFSFVDSVYESQGARNPRLEEVELSEDGGYWLVTVSMEAASQSSYEAAAGVKNRDFKVIKVRARDGQADSMRIGTLL